MSLIDSLVNCSEHVLQYFLALLQIKHPAFPVLRCHHSTFTREREKKKKNRDQKEHTDTWATSASV